MAYDVFISFKNTAPDGSLTRDRAIAERLHSLLREEGLEVFFSEKDLISTEFMDDLYRALDEAQLLIVVGTSLEYIQSKWVKNEWQNFLGAINNGKKPRGQIMTVLDGISARYLPIEISNFQSFKAEDTGSIVNYAFRTLGKVKNSDAAALLAHEQNAQSREDEEAALREMRLKMESEYARKAESNYLSDHAAQLADLQQREAYNKAELERIQQKKQEAVYKKIVEVQEAYRRRKTRSIVLACCAVLVVAVIALIIVETRKPLRFSPVNGGYSITGCSKDYSDPDLPEAYRGEPVVSIAPNAFAECEKLTSVVIPDSIEHIGDGAFKDCINLVSVTMPDGITAISDSTFWGCGRLSDINIPGELTTIGDHAFYRCEDLLSITIPDSVTHIGNGAFYGCVGITDIIIPDSVTYLGDSVFQGCSNLASVAIPDSIPYIGYASFSGCSSLVSVALPDSITNIDDCAFSSCDFLTSVTIPDSVTRISESAFENCEELTDIFVSAKNPNYRDIDGVLFSKDGTTLITFPCGKPLVAYTVPDGVAVIGDFAFDRCVYLRNITIPESVTTIHGNSFYWYSITENEFYSGDQELYNITVTAPYDVRYYDYSPNGCIRWVVE